MRPRSERVQQQERLDVLQVAAATGSGSRRLDEFATLPGMPLMKQESIE